jgi:4-hydroxy-tetrahydrodipicolinate synthase
MFSGTFTALVTPMSNGEIDCDALRELVEWQIAEGITGVVPCGTTGEACTLSDEETALVVRTVVEQTKKRVPVIGGAGSNNTIKAVKLSRIVAEAGADALLHVTPYYNKPNVEGLLAHYRQITEAVDLPVIAYNVPGRTGCDTLPSTVAALAENPRVVAIKEATGSLARGAAVINAVPKDFSVLSGDDFSAMPLVAMGGHGVISVITNIIPKEFGQIMSMTEKGDLKGARALHYKYLRLLELLFEDANPIPVKAAVAMMGYCKNEIRLPLLPLEGALLEEIRAEMTKLGLVK